MGCFPAGQAVITAGGRLPFLLACRSQGNRREHGLKKNWKRSAVRLPVMRVRNLVVAVRILSNVGKTRAGNWCADSGLAHQINGTVDWQA